MVERSVLTEVHDMKEKRSNVGEICGIIPQESAKS